MGALAPLTNWIQDDDLLLKNAVEAGASLESLAKGAVCFSQRFTLRELQDRWYTLLYNSGTSEETSGHMIEIDVDFATSNPNKGNRNCNLKGNYLTSGKRKGDSIRNHYYARKKCVRNGSCDTENPGFVVAHCPPLATGTVYCCGDKLNQYQADKIYPGEHALNCYGYSEAGYGNEHSIFPEMLGLSSAVSGGNNSHPEFHAEYGRPVEDECPNVLVDRDYMCDFEENISPELVDKAQLNKAEEPFENDYVQKDSPQFLEQNIASFDASKDMHENKLNLPLPVSQPFDSKIKEISPASENENYDIAHENNKSSLHVTCCGDSSNHLGCSSIKTCLPHSEMVTGISSQTVMMNMHIEGEEGLPMGDNINKLELNCLSPDVDVLDGVSDIGINEPAMISESDLMDFSGDFMEFAGDEDLIFINIDDKDIGDSSCLNGLSSILLNSPNNTHEDDHANLSDLKETDNLDVSVNILEDTYSEGTKQNCDRIWSIDNDLTESVSGQNFPTSSSGVSHVAETLERLPICALNLQDSEIPCNDDALLTAQLLPQFSATTKLLSSDGKLPLVDTNKVKEEQMAAHSAVSPFTAIPSALPKVRLLNSNNDGRLEPKSFERVVTDGVSRDAGLAAKERTPCTLQSVALQSSAGTLLKEEFKFDTLVNLSLEIPAAGTDHAKLQTLNSSDGCKSQAISTSDQEHQVSESEEDVPNFSDVESLILDMDLGPYDQESCLFTKEASLYQPVHNKQVIMRLEQSATAYMKRKILANGAIAVIYGRYLKYFIKKPEVSLGRGTDDVEVDIDLREEGPSNRISRRQAIIKLDKDGSFVLKNIGKCSIFVQSKEVPAKKRIVLSSMCLIQIRALRFLFHYNEDATMSYLDTANQASKGRTT